MADKYWRDSCRPWLPVTPDPLPAPKPSREYVKAIIDRFNRTPGEPNPPLPKISTTEALKAITDRYNGTGTPSQAL